MTDQPTGRALHVKASFRLSEEHLRAIVGQYASFALLRIQSDIEDCIRRIVRKQLRAILAEIGGDPWHYSVAEPLHTLRGGPKAGNVLQMEVKHGE